MPDGLDTLSNNTVILFAHSGTPTKSTLVPLAVCSTAYCSAVPVPEVPVRAVVDKSSMLTCV